MLNILNRFLSEEDGVAIVEFILLLAIVLAIALILRKALVKFVIKILESLNLT